MTDDIRYGMHFIRQQQQMEMDGNPKHTSLRAHQSNKPQNDTSTAETEEIDYDNNITLQRALWDSTVLAYRTRSAMTSTNATYARKGKVWKGKGTSSLQKLCCLSLRRYVGTSLSLALGTQHAQQQSATNQLAAADKMEWDRDNDERQRPQALARVNDYKPSGQERFKTVSIVSNETKGEERKERGGGDRHPIDDILLFALQLLPHLRVLSTSITSVLELYLIECVILIHANRIMALLPQLSDELRSALCLVRCATAYDTQEQHTSGHKGKDGNFGHKGNDRSDRRGQGGAFFSHLLARLVELTHILPHE